jgi:hypothetical protein
MATLTGQTISSTYDGLLKTTDNDVLNADGKEITDGLGNGSGVSLDTNGNIVAQGTVKAIGGIRDTSNDLGTSGQVLSSTGTGTNWINSTAPVDSVNGATGVVVLDSDDIAEGSTNEYLLADSVTYAKLGAEFTTSAAVGATTLDFSTAQVFTKANSGTVTYTITNADTGMVKDLILTGTGSFSITGGKLVAGSFVESVTNFIQIVAQSSSIFWYSISQEQ